MKTTRRTKICALALAVGMTAINASAVSFSPDVDETYVQGSRYTLLQDKQNCFPSINAERIENLKKLIETFERLREKGPTVDCEASKPKITSLQRLRLQCESERVCDRVAPGTDCPREVPDGGSSIALLAVALFALGAIQVRKMRRAWEKLRPVQAESRLTQNLKDR